VEAHVALGRALLAQGAFAEAAPPRSKPSSYCPKTTLYART
jgi:hypothetical protein